MKQDMMNFINNAATAFQAVAETAAKLEKNGYERLYEADEWKIVPGDKKYVVRNDSSLIAFRVPKQSECQDSQIMYRGFRMICAHSDSPSFKIKETPGMVSGETYLKLNVENYGGMIKESWMDRPLSVAGRVVVRSTESGDGACADMSEAGLQLKTKLIDMKRPLFVIPSLAPHMKRGGEKDGELNTQLHMLPLAGTNPDKEMWNRTLAEAAQAKPEDILGADLYLYPVCEPVCMGLEEELIGAPRLDDLACVYCGLKALLDSENMEKNEQQIAVLAVFDNEEVGSQTMQGAASNFLSTVLRRVGACLRQNLDRMLAGSFLLSADNAHALHPNYADKADPTNCPQLNKGIVIKYHGGQKYTTSAYSGAFVKAICEEKKIPYQTYHNRSDIAGGSTLGNIVLTNVSVPAADVGLAQLAMHSTFETMGAQDLSHMVELMKAFYC